MSQRLVLLLPLWAALLGAVAMLDPAPFITLKAAIVPLLALIMFAMGLTLDFDDFKRALAMPRLIGLGLLLQFGIMPLSAWLLARAFALDPVLTAGMVLTGAAPGGTASNVMSWLARGNVAVSITLTACATVLAIFLTPALSWLLIGNRIDVPALAMLASVARIVLLPVLAGVLINHFLGHRLGRVRPLLPALAVAAIVLIIAIIIALNHARLAGLSPILLLAVIAHNATGLAAGYGLGRLAGYDARLCRTLAIEVGMQNSGLAVALATQYFPPLAALPGALFSFWHNLSGALIAAWWRRADRQKTTDESNT